MKNKSNAISLNTCTNSYVVLIRYSGLNEGMSQAKRLVDIWKDYKPNVESGKEDVCYI